jgi:TATA-box binding protein (TBP) (component of TFIID and TFIIIB)
MRKRHYSLIDETENKDNTAEIEHPLGLIDSDPPLTTIHNLVGTCEIDSSIVPIDLEHVARCLPNSFYDRKRFAAITIRITNPVCTALLFTSGKLVLTGTKCLMECVLAALKITRMLERHMPAVTFLMRNAVVQNVVAHAVIPLKQGQKLNLARMYEDHGCNSTYAKQMFPGLIYRPNKSPVVLLCFYSGRIVLTGTSLTPLNSLDNHLNSNHCQPARWTQGGGHRYRVEAALANRSSICRVGKELCKYV